MGSWSRDIRRLLGKILHASVLCRILISRNNFGNDVLNALNHDTPKGAFLEYYRSHRSYFKDTMSDLSVLFSSSSGPLEYCASRVVTFPDNEKTTQTVSERPRRVPKLQRTFIRSGNLFCRGNSPRSSGQLNPPSIIWQKYKQ